MDITTGSLLRRITQTDLSTAAHKLATLILDGIAWRDGYNGLTRGTAAFTLQVLAEKMGVSRQYLAVLLAELETSPLRLERQKPHGKYAPWLFRFGAGKSDEAEALLSSRRDTSLSMRDLNKNVFSGRIDVIEDCRDALARWAALISDAKAVLPCWNVDTQQIWERFIAFNRKRGHTAVPAGYLLGFMRRWRASPSVPGNVALREGLRPPADVAQQELLLWSKAAPSANWRYHGADLRRVIGDRAYEARIAALVSRFHCVSFTAMLAVHGRAVMAGEIDR